MFNEEASTTYQDQLSAGKGFGFQTVSDVFNGKMTIRANGIHDISLVFEYFVQRKEKTDARIDQIALFQREVCHSAVVFVFPLADAPLQGWMPPRREQAFETPHGVIGYIQSDKQAHSSQVSVNKYQPVNQV